MKRRTAKDNAGKREEKWVGYLSGTTPRDAGDCLAVVGDGIFRSHGFLHPVTRERQDPVPTLERWNDQKVVLLTGVSDLPGSLPDAHDRGHGPLLVRLRGAESEGCKSPPGRRLLPET